MKIEHIGDISSENPLFIKDTKDITTKRLLTLFLDTYSPLCDLYDNSESAKAINAIAETWEKEKRDANIYRAIARLPIAVCRCFLEFINDCPNIHITID